MLRTRAAAAALAALMPAGAFAQTADTSRASRRTLPSDSLRTVEGGPVVVTATRDARRLADVPVPTAVVTKEQMVSQGSLRLSDLLAEQPGLALLDGVGGGTGLQLQGFSSDYTLILVDGEPVIGRSAGVLDLNRFAVSGVERVEIVRGPTSSRYGSEALAGVVNLITRRPGEALRGSLTARAESFGTYDLSAEGEAGTERVGGRVRVGRLTSDGFDLLPDAPGTSAPAFTDYSAETRLRFAPGGATRLGLSARTQAQTQHQLLPVGASVFDQRGRRFDASATPTLRHRFSSSWVLDASLHGALFQSRAETVRPDGSRFDSTGFVQGYGKAEASLGYVRSAQYAAYAGGGMIGERVSGDRYDTAKTASQAFGFAEMQWMPTARWDVNVSARVDAPSDYAARFSPKVAVLFKPADALRVRASVGSGYKAPAFRQRYLSFTNAAGGGYSVFGAEEVRARLDALHAAGAIANVLIPADRLGSLRAESSVALTAGAEAAFGSLSVRADAFRHHVRDLIETQAVAVLTNGQGVFSYFNLSRIVSEGVEAELTWRPSGRLFAAASYQFLRTYDREIVDAIGAGSLYWRDANGRDRLVRRSDYDGLIQRSPHSGTARVEYRMPRLDALASVRVVWRSAYGYRDLDGNGVFVSDTEVAPGYALVHATATRAFGRAQVQAGVRNLFDRTDAERLPGQPGRALFVGATYDF